MKPSLIITLFALFPSLSVALNSDQIIIGSRVVVEHSAEGDVIAAEEPMTEEECSALAEAQGLGEVEVQTLQQRLAQSEVRFNADVFGRSLVARELQLCLAKEKL